MTYYDVDGSMHIHAAHNRPSSAGMLYARDESTGEQWYPDGRGRWVADLGRSTARTQAHMASLGRRA